MTMNKSSETLPEQEKANILITCNPDLKLRLKAVAEREHRSLSSQACYFLEQGLSNPILEKVLEIESDKQKGARRFKQPAPKAEMA